MLVLSRKANESLTIGNDIKITIVGINGDKVRVGIEAPRSVRILRTETLDQTIAQNKAIAAAVIDMDMLMDLKLQVKE